MSGCTLELELYKHSILRSTLTDQATGQARYRVETPITISGDFTRIKKLESHAQPTPHPDWDTDSDTHDHITDGKKAEGKLDFKEVANLESAETSDEVARIHFKVFTSDKIFFQGKMYTRKEFLPRGKVKGSYMFTGPDGVQYRWASGISGEHPPRLVTTDEKTVIAEFHQPNYVTKRQKPRLQVHPEGMHMLDHIVLTFVYVEHQRGQREAEEKPQFIM